ncbi:MAG: NAD(P)H-hydrate dehydratase [Ruminococcus sp.]|nr:NAD(P)H-hydrate dehydratase [Ruminococcus sp.]
MFYPTPKQMKTIEANSEKDGLSCRELMERAGDAIAMQICSIGLELSLSSGTVFICGSGNNAGDAFVAARLLAQIGFPVTIVLVCGDPSTEMAMAEYCELSEYGNVEVLNAEDNSKKLKKIMSEAAVIVDAVYGTGFHGFLPKKVKDCLAMAERSSAIKIAADMPSGGDSLNGTVAEGAIKADFTLAFGYKKIGMLIQPLSDYCGEIITSDIGLTEKCLDGIEYLPELLEDEAASELIPKRKKNSYKGDFGKLLNVSGCAEMSGAAFLSTKAALRSGVGLVTLASVGKVIDRIGSAIPEATYLPLTAGNNGEISEKNADKILERCANKTALLIGCGLSATKDTKALVQKLVKEAACPIILDADGINCIADNIDIIRNAKAEVIVTPHTGELARLSGITVSEAASDRLTAAVNISRDSGAVVVAKGVPNFVAGEGRAYIIPAGNPGLSRGGSGDVLAGIIAAFRAQGLSAVDSAALGVLIHGEAADIAAEELSETGMLPSDVIERLPFVFKKRNR